MDRKHKGLPHVLIAVISFVLGVAVMLGAARYGGGLLRDFLGFERRSDSGDADTETVRLLEQAYAVLGYIGDGDYKGLSGCVHPERGVLFSPYATISLSANRLFTASQLAAFGSDKSEYVWGVYDGNGDAIELTPGEYFERFVFDRDYISAPVVIGVDCVVRSGNSLENIKDIMPGTRFVDFHIPATDEDGMDWSSLRLGFEEYRGELRLTFIGHSQWTV